MILGGSGMLGHRLALDLSKEHDVFVTTRDREYLLSGFGFPRDKILANIDARVPDRLRLLFFQYRPDIVINAIGVLQHYGESVENVLGMTWVNAAFPLQLAEICADLNIRLIHFSTDCVFSGAGGNYREDDMPDAYSFYGRTKYLGEVAAPALTIRTSFIGHEIHNGSNLLDWFLAQTGKVTGYKYAHFSGVTTNEIARALLEYILPGEIGGVYHLAGPRISKYDLLLLLKDAYNKPTKIEMSYTPLIDRSLNGDMFQAVTGYHAPPWPDMLQKMIEVHHENIRVVE
jgi:dTDP-4-dehydrorhamnose reductase